MTNRRKPSSTPVSLLLNSSLSRASGAPAAQDSDGVHVDGVLCPHRFSGCVEINKLGAKFFSKENDQQAVQAIKKKKHKAMLFGLQAVFLTLSRSLLTLSRSPLTLGTSR